MTWFKVDDKLHDHRKARAAGATAMGVWLLAGSWAADNLTDGFIPAAILPRWGRPRDATRLVEVGLWHAAEEAGEKGWKFHEWAERQPTRAQTLALREQKAEAGRAGGLRSGRSRREAGAKQSASSLVEPPTRPDPNPSRPTDADASVVVEPSEPTAGKPATTRRGHQLPEDFVPNDTNRRIAAERGLDLRAVFEQFADHHRAKGSTMKDWHLALNTWLRRERPGAGTPAAGPSANLQAHLALVRQLADEESGQPRIGGAS